MEEKKLIQIWNNLKLSLTKDNLITFSSVHISQISNKKPLKK